MDLARSIQDVTEEILFRMAKHVRKETGLKNLCLAGDYCRSEVDIVCLEGAVLTARRAARAIAKRAGCEEKVPEPAASA